MDGLLSAFALPVLASTLILSGVICAWHAELQRRPSRRTSLLRSANRWLRRYLDRFLSSS
jgi:hypothetical protein